MMRFLLFFAFIMTAIGDEEWLWTNWAQNEQQFIDTLFLPTTKEEIVDAVQKAAAAGKTLKVLGSGHSLSAIGKPEPENWAMSLESYNKIVSIDTTRKTVTVQGGKILRELHSALYEKGLAFPILATTSEQTVSGLIQTGTHGTGKNYGPLHTQVIEMTVINGMGEIKTLNNESDPELFQAYLCGLGALGIIESLTFQLTDAFHLHEKSYAGEWPEILDEIVPLVNRNDRVSLYWFPYSNQIGVWTANPTKKPVGKIQKEAPSIAVEDLVKAGDIEQLHKLLFKAEFDKDFERIDRTDQILSVFNIPSNIYASECSILLKDAKQFLLELGTLLIENRFPAHKGIEIRFARADSAFLSLTQSNNPEDIFCFVSTCVVRPKGSPVSHSEYFSAFTALVEKYRGRLHWGKMGTFRPEYLPTAYPQWEKFRNIQKQEDPNGVFLNDFTRRIFR